MFVKTSHRQAASAGLRPARDTQNMSRCGFDLLLGTVTDKNKRKSFLQQDVRPDKPFVPVPAGHGEQLPSPTAGLIKLGSHWKQNPVPAPVPSYPRLHTEEENNRIKLILRTERLFPSHQTVVKTVGFDVESILQNFSPHSTSFSQAKL